MKPTIKPGLVLLLAAACCETRICAFQDYPQQIGDLVFRDSNGQIYGRDGTGFSMASSHPGHVGIFIGNGEIVEALGHGVWIVRDVTGEVMVTPLQAAAGVHSFYEDWEGPDGVEDHGHMGARTHKRLLELEENQAAVLRSNIVYLALDQVAEGYDNSFRQQKGPGPDQWTCCGLAEKVYESCAGRVIIPDPENYPDESAYTGGLNITADGFGWQSDGFSYFYQNNFEFSQIPINPLFGRVFGGIGSYRYFIFFPFTQFEQASLIDAFRSSHTADFRRPLWIIDGREVSRVLAYWRAGVYHIDALGADGYAPGAGSKLGQCHSADYREPFWVIDSTEVGRVLAYWRACAYHRSSSGPDGFAPGEAPSNSK